MSPTVRQYSFFNRWFIFKRRRGGSLPEPEEPVPAPPAPAATAQLATKKGPTLSKAQLNAEKARLVRKMSVDEAFGELADTPSQTASVAGPSVAAAQGASVAAAQGASVAAAQGASVAAAPEASAANVKQLVIKAPQPAAAKPLHTIPVQEQQRRKYALSELFQFYIDASQVDKLKLGDPDAGRWISPSAPFPIVDDGVSYPSVEHYLAAMKYKMATNKPELAAKIFSQEGEVHQSFLRTRATESAQGARALTAQRDHDLLKAERAKVIEESSVGTSGMKKYRATFDEGKWFGVKDGLLREALKQRWE
jgi:hypothetical protein